MIYFILIGYILLTILVGFVFTKRPDNNPESYFLSDRNLKTFSLFFTLIATNFSAFFFLGFAGEGYRIGYAYYPMMALGTSFAALSFYMIGNVAWKLSKAKGYITPIEVMRGVSKSDAFANVYLIIMVVFMLPYLAVQPIGAGLILENISGGSISYTWGVILMTIFIVTYILIGGMKSVISMDIKNGILLLSFMLIAVIAIVHSLGGLTAMGTQLLEKVPEVYSPQGINNYFSPVKWISFMILWLTCLPMFPQIFTRFMISKDLKSFKQSTFLYTLIPPFLFLIPVMIGVMGHLTFPDIVGKDSDRILPMMLSAHVPEWLAALILFGALAAFISTVDSVLLALGTIGTRDIYLKYINPNAGKAKQVRIGKYILVFLAIISLLIALVRPASIFTIVTMTFSGSAILFPVTLAYFYWNGIRPKVAVAALVLGELVMISFTLGWLDKVWLGEMLPVVPGILVTTLILLIGRQFNVNSLAASS